MNNFRSNLQKVLQRFKLLLPPSSLFMWNATMPVSSQIRSRGTFLLPDISFMQHVLQGDVLEANFYAQQVVRDLKFDFLDLHYYFRNQLQHRKPDGVHWDEIVHRRITNLLLTHICEAFNFGLPARNPDLHPNQCKPNRTLFRNPQQAARPRMHRRADTCDPAYLRGSYHGQQIEPQEPQYGNYELSAVEATAAAVLNAVVSATYFQNSFQPYNNERSASGPMHSNNRNQGHYRNRQVYGNRQWH